MLYHLFEYLNSQFHIPGGGLWNYISFRAILAGSIALICAIIIGKHFIAFMNSRHIYETQRDEKIDHSAASKKNVPTMGGIIIIFSLMISVLLFCKLNSVYTLLMIATTLILGCLGFADDYIKTFKKNKDGIKPIVKLAGQVTVGLLVGLTLRFSPSVVMNEHVERTIENNVIVYHKTPEIKSTRTTIPFVKNHNANYADMFSFLGNNWKYKAGWIFFIILITLVVMGTSNGANLNDGMDGMAAGNSAIMGLGLVVLAYVSSSTFMAEYLKLMYIPGSEELVVFLAAFVGALIGFLWYNFAPAEIFMGDTGSLCIGGIIAVSACIIHKEWLLPILCGVFVMEALSVMIQTRWFRLGKKRGVEQRVWKRSPIHDHFRYSYDEVKKDHPNCSYIFKGEKKGQAETKIVVRFWLVSLLLLAFTILTLKIR